MDRNVRPKRQYGEHNRRNRDHQTGDVENAPCVHAGTVLRTTRYRSRVFVNPRAVIVFLIALLFVVGALIFGSVAVCRGVVAQHRRRRNE
jgi:hypothetical protein